jgi:hypothetical protein
MCVRNHLKEIKGIVFQDTGNDRSLEEQVPLMKGIGIDLFLVADKEIENNNKSEITIYREKRICRTTTNDKGEFRFVVHHGTYSIKLDIETLPFGKGVIEPGRLVPFGETESIGFAVKDVSSVQIDKNETRLDIGEELLLNPVVKDAEGNILTARLNFSSESTDLSFRSNLCRSCPKTLRDHNADILIDAGNVAKKVPLEIRVPGLCSADKIKLACKLGIIDENMKIQYLTYALQQSGKLPKEYRSSVPIKSGTGILEELNQYMENRNADPTVREAARHSISSSVPELDKTYRSPSGYFNIHYTLEGDNAVDFNLRNYRAVPPYITQVGEAFDNVRAITCFTRGFRQPVLDEGKKDYDIYVYDLKDKYGVTYSSKLYSSRHYRSAASSYICIDNSYSREKGFDKSRLECMKVTAAHEFFHAVQFAYNAHADTWWKEASATWNEDEIYTGINDYVRYIGSYFKTPYKSLDETSYSGVIFAKFLEENYGGYDTIRKIWEIHSTGYDNSIQAIDRFLRTSFSGKDIGTVYNQFSAYNTNPAQYYKEGASWNISAAAQNTYARYPVSMNLGLLNHLSSNYQLFKPGDPGEGRSLRIVLEGADGARLGFQLQKRSSVNKLYSTTEITSRGIYDRAEIDLKGFGTAFDEVWFIPANLETELNRMPYTYSADLK